MTIKAGFGGQEFLPELLDKVRTARRHVDAGPPGAAHRGRRRDRRGHHRARRREAGADTFVAGTAVFGAADPAAAVRHLRDLARRGDRRIGRPARRDRRPTGPAATAILVVDDDVDIAALRRDEPARWRAST